MSNSRIFFEGTLTLAISYILITCIHTYVRIKILYIFSRIKITSFRKFHKKYYFYIEGGGVVKIVPFWHTYCFTLQPEKNCVRAC